MGMASHQLGVQAVADRGQIEAPFFPGDLGVQHHLQQQVAQFFG